MRFKAEISRPVCYNISEDVDLDSLNLISFIESRYTPSK